ncbi:unnamed protein product [Soboliphyme baturini]|uniref:Zinc finger protein n=1 Tax=Soboliphyme baturini TaxID=241478 RepID=A0A183IR73_9BILA|nr:unnamed protein product [Soboliphyme baturini]
MVGDLSGMNSNEVYEHIKHEQMNAGVDYAMDTGMTLDQLSSGGHQCPICLKVFVSSKGLQQHSIIHTDRKPFSCEICGKPFRFKSNLFEHRSIHTGETPYACPFCGKACRLKGNLKKHLKTHVKEADEIDRAYEAVTGSTGRHSVMCLKNGESGDESCAADSPYLISFAKGRQRRKTVNPRKIAKAPSVALVVTVGQDEQEEEPFAEAPPTFPPLTEMIGKEYSMAEFCKVARAIPFETHQCRLCHLSFRSRMEMRDHCEMMHNMSQQLHENGVGEGFIWCETCIRPFDDQKSYDQHMSFHRRIRSMVNRGDLVLNEPDAPSL